MEAVYIVITVMVAAKWIGQAGGGFPMVNPTVGDIWPRPHNAEFDDTYLMVIPDTFTFTVDGHTCDIVEEAITRYMKIIFQTASSQSKPRQPFDGSSDSRDYLDHLRINLLEACEEYPHQDMDEAYELTINGAEAFLDAHSVWGVLRGMETFSQLLLPESPNFIIRATRITDFPRFTYRGLMLDTSRHYIPPSKIYETLDLMAMNKFNVFHWHIVDDQSFPYASSIFPDLSRLGAYTPLHVYAVHDVVNIIEYARLLGIRVIPEFDTPGHTRSWGPGQVGLLTPCYDGSEPDGSFGPIDPSVSENYDFLGALFLEVSTRFPDTYIHLGADEVPFGCWESNPQIADFMDQLGIGGLYQKLEEFYITKLFDTVTDYTNGKSRFMVWQDVFDNGVSLADGSVVQVWQDEYYPENFMAEIEKVTYAGYFAVLSSCWYLNIDTFGSDWFDYYTCDPHDFDGSEAQKQLVLGGEACVWTEYEDRTNLIPRTWPRAALVAEKLWSASWDTASTDGLPSRLDEHRCRLLARGYDVEPLLPSYCSADLI